MIRPLLPVGLFDPLGITDPSANPGSVPCRLPMRKMVGGRAPGSRKGGGPDTEEIGMIIMVTFEGIHANMCTMYLCILHT